MKRPALHIVFWTAYLLQDALLQFLWVAPALPAIPDNEQFLMALRTAVVVLIPKLAFTYYIIYIAIGRMFKEKSKPVGHFIIILLLLFVAIIVYRIIFNYYVYPTIYNGALKMRPLFDLRTILMALMDIGFVAGTAITLKLLRIQLAGKVREKNLLKEKLETELKFLRNQTNPHFLFNTLNNIYGLARKKSDDTAEVVMKLSKLLRFMIYESVKEFINITDEIRMLEDYLELEKIRYNNRLKIVFKKDIDDFTHRITPLLLLPLIENAFKHGVSETTADSFIRIEMKLLCGQLTFEIENTKADEPIHKSHSKIGLLNLKRQLELIYKDYDLQVHNTSQIFKVHLFINLNNHANI